MTKNLHAAQPGTALAEIEDIKLPVKFLTEEVTDVLDKIKAAALARAADLDVSRKADRDLMISTAFKVSRSKTGILAVSKSLKERTRAEIAEVLNGILTEEKRIEADLDALRDQIRKPVTDWEDAEKARIAGHEAALTHIQWLADLAKEDGLDAATIDQCLDGLEAYLNLNPRDWQEFSQRAEKIIAFAKEDLSHRLARALQRDAEQAELARLQAAEAERLRKEHEAQIAAVAAENARREAEDKARAEAEAEAARVEAVRRADAERVERERLATEEKARQEREAAAAREREIQAAADRAEEQRKRAELDRIAAENRERVAAQKIEEDRITRNKSLIESVRKVGTIPSQPDLASSLRTRFDTLADLAARPVDPDFYDELVGAVSVAHQGISDAIIAAEAREALDAEANRRHLAEAELRRQEAAIEAERARVAKIAAQEQAEKAKREADQAHRKTVNCAARDAVAFLLAAGGEVGDELGARIATEIVNVIALGKIPHVTISY